MTPDPHIISSLTAALAFALVFLAIDEGVLAAGGLLRRRAAMKSGIRPEPGDDFRRRLDGIEHRTGSRLRAAFILASVFSILYIAGHDPWWSRLDARLWWTVSGLLIGAAAYELWLVIRLLSERACTARELHAHVAIGQRLEHVAARGNYLFHCLPVGAASIDHVVLGTNGVYAVKVLALPRARSRTSRLAGGCILFGDREDRYSLAEWNGILRGFKAVLRAHLGHSVRVMSVLVVPGHTVETAEGDESVHLLVNEDSLMMMTGWRDQAAFLLDEEVEQLRQFFTEQ